MNAFGRCGRQLLVAALGCLAAFSASAQIQQSGDNGLDLAYKFSDSDHFEISQRLQQDSYLTLNEGPQRTTNTTKATISFIVQSVQGGTATIAVSYVDIFLHVSLQDQTVTVNTAEPPKDVYGRLFQKMVGETFTLQLLNDGTIKEISGLDAIFDKMIAGTPEVKKDEQATLKKFLQSQFGAETLRSSLAFVLPHYPSRILRIDDSWTNQLSTEGFYHGQIDNYWKLAYADKYVIKLTNKGKFTTNPSEEVDMGDGHKGYVDLQGEVQGQYTLDPETNWPATCVIHSELGGKYIYKPAKRRKDNIEVPVRTVMDATYKFKHF